MIWLIENSKENILEGLGDSYTPAKGSLITT